MEKKVRKKILLMVCFAACLLLLSGCSFSDLLSWGAGVKSDPDFQTWEKLSEKGKLDSDGQYTADAVHVTFSRNSFLEVHYFSDPDMKTEYPETGCYLLPGDSLYYSVKVAQSSEGIYSFDHLDVVEYDENNARMGLAVWNESGSPFLQIPYDYTGTEVSIEPVGHFGDRQINLQASVADRSAIDGGTWYINGEPTSAGTVSVKTLDTYYLEYRYDSAKYYFVQAIPEPWKTDEGIVVFNASGAKTGVESFDIICDSYASADITVKNGEIQSVASSDSESAISSTKNGPKTWSVSGIRPGSKVIVRVTSEEQNNLSVNSPSIQSKVGNPTLRELNGQKYYECEIEFGDINRFMFIPSEYTVPHGTIEFSCDGKVISERTMLDSGMKIQYTAKDVEEGFWLPDNGGTITVKGSQTANELRQIRFYPEKTVSVFLPQPVAGGKIEYSASGNPLEGLSADLLCGTRVFARFTADKGWDPQLQDGAVYIVSDAATQSAVFGDESGEKAIDKLFMEQEGHKPKLTVSIHTNLNNSQTSVIASGYRLDNQTVTGGNNFLDPFKTIISDKTVGTDQGVTLLFSQIDLRDGNNAIRITVSKDADTKKYKEIFYVSKANTPFVIPFDKEKVYTSVTIQLEAVKANSFTLLSVPDTDVSARFVDVELDSANETTELTDGTVISGERQLELTIKPHEGFFMEGSNTKDDIYTRIMSYDDYRKLSAEDLLKQRKTICSIDLIEEDDFGTVKYYIDGKACSGIQQVREGKEIVVKYELTDESYEIVKGRDILSLVDSSASKKDEKKVKVVPEMHGTKLRREDVIEIRKKVTE